MWSGPRDTLSRRVIDGTHWASLLLSAALKDMPVPYHVEMRKDKNDNGVIAVFVLTRNDDVVEILSPVQHFPSKMLIETITLVY